MISRLINRSMLNMRYAGFMAMPTKITVSWVIMYYNPDLLHSSQNSKKEVKIAPVLN
jgi:hypothetical protein